MRLRLKSSAFSLIIGLFLISSVVSAQTDSAQSGKITFPEVEGWEMGDITTYPTAELGYSITYRSGDVGTVTIYVYNNGVKKIADGIEDTIVKNQIKQAGDDIMAFGEAGYYENVKRIIDGNLTLDRKNGKVKALYSLFYFKVRGAEVDSEIYLFGYKNNFIKIRATHPKGTDRVENRKILDLFAEFDKMFAK